MEIKGKIALVTGASKRVGHQIAMTLARRGATILVHYRSSKDEAVKTVSEIAALGGAARLLEGDLARASDVSRIAEAAGTVDILVNSASLYYKTPLETVTESDWDRLL